MRMGRGSAAGLATWLILLLHCQAQKVNVTEVPYVLTGISMRCPNGWDLIGDKCYRIYSTEKSWPQAQIFCERYGASLAKVESTPENQFLARLLSTPARAAHSAQAAHWIGLVRERADALDEAMFVWSDGQAVSRFEGFWARGQPDLGLGNCGRATHDGALGLEWGMEMCNVMLPFVCQLPACVSGSFHCGNGRCIPEKAHCNGHNDCGDLSDELNCPQARGDANCLKYERGESGRIESPNFPSSYAPNLNCKWVMEGPANSRIQLIFEQFETEQDQDLVTVLDGGPAENATFVLDHLSGQPKPSRLTITSSTNMLSVRFRTDLVGQAKGFQATWRAIPFSCGGVLKAQLFAQTFSSPRPYPAGGECVWRIEAPEGQLISLNVEDFEIEDRADMLIVYDGPHPSAPVLSKLTGTMRNQLIISTQNRLYLYFYSNYANSAKGFTISYRRGCNNTITYEHGSLLSPGHGLIPYANSQVCKYTIEMREPMAQLPVSMVIHNYDVHPGDQFRVFEESEQGQLIQDGVALSDGKVRQISSKKGKVVILFDTNAMKSGMGWNLTFSTNCPPLKVPKSVFLTTQNSSYGSKVTVNCQTGFEFKNGMGRRFDVTCELGGKWSSDYIPECQPVFCSAVPQIANGYALSASNVSYGGVAKYKCYDGFHFPSGRATAEVTCKEDGWADTPKCVAEVCRALPPFQNGQRLLKFGDNTGFGTVYEFGCNPGYRHSGPSTILCKADGRWSAEQPVCRKLICPKIPHIKNGKLVLPQTGRLQFGDSAHVECLPGFRSTGADSVKCLADQTLSQVPECKDIDECDEGIASCFTKSTKCVNFEGGYHSCPSFHVLSPRTVRTSSGNFYNSTFCAESKDNQRYVEFAFASPKVLERIRFEKTDFGIPVSVSVQYAPDLRSALVNAEEMTELPLKNVEMAGSQVVVLKRAVEAQVVRVRVDKFREGGCGVVELLGCQKTACADVDECATANGHCDHQCHNTPGAFRCACRNGFDLFVRDGQAGLFVREAETGADPGDLVRFNQTCVPRKCPRLRLPPHAQVVSAHQELAYPSLLEFKCEHGFQIKGARALRCTADGVWNGTVPSCVPAVCEGVQNNTGIGMFVTTDKPYIPYGENVTVVCTQQNRPLRQSPLGGVRQCIYDPRPDGVDYWLSGTPADCPLVECGAPPALAGAYYEGEDASFKVGSSLTFNCRPPYSLLGKSSYDDRTVRCNVDGAWDLGDLRCEGPVCVDPGHPEAGQTHLSSVEEGAVARFSCDRVGFRPFPHDSINCTLGTSCLLSEDVGISNGYIPDGAFSDSDTKTMWGFEPHKARLSSTGWCGSKDAFIFLSVDLQRIYTLNTLRLAGVAGSGYLKGHVTKLQLFYKVQFSQNYDTYPMDFSTAPGNHNKMYQFQLDPPIRARYILLGVTEYEENPCLKFDLHGCLAPLSTAHEIPSHLQVGWNASVPQCMDAEPPVFLNCPANPIFAQTDEFGQLLPIKFETPEVHDNSGIVAHIKIEPREMRSPFHIHAPLDVKYTAFDEAGNSAECVVQLRIPDTQPPAMKCPDSYAVYASANETSKRVFFNENTTHVVIHDLSNITEFVISPAQADIRLYSSVDVEATATDSHNNRASCKFQVALLPEPCSELSLLSDEHALKKCTSTNGSTSCTIRCQPGFRFVNASLDELSFGCEPGADWQPRLHPPACVPKAREPARYELSVALDFGSAVPARPECMRPYEEAVALAFDDHLDQDLTHKCSSAVRVLVRLGGAHFRVDAANNKLVHANLSVQVLPSVQQLVFYELCGLTLSTLFNLHIPGAALPLKSVLQLPSGGLNAPNCLPMTASDAVIDQGFTCGRGEVLNKEEGELPECVPCAKGSALAQNKCVLCPAGSYQDKDGQTECKKCAEGTFTRTEGATSRTECLQVCGNGMFSESGLIPCQLCPRHTFAGPPLLGGFQQCDPCPDGTYTAELGATGPRKCRQPCAAGHFSESGLEPCSPCPLHFFQPSLGQQRCLQCANHTVTAATGRANESDCAELDCTGVKCQNKGVCTVRHHKAVCDCRPGFSGDFCEKLVPICDTNPCLNGGSCENVAGTFRCTCPQNFTGSRCQFGPDECIGVNCPNGGVCQDLPGVDSTKCVCRTGFVGADCSEIADPCQSENPCKNGADCVPLQLGRFKCKCLPGWEGPTCERNIDDCKDQPCALGAVCHDLVNDFECECPHGFAGKRCHVKQNLCEPNPCIHGDCVDRLFDRTCVCHSGWTGANCEQNIDECASAPCQNGGTCRDKENGYDCDCPAGFYGVQCQHMVDHCAAGPCQHNATCVNLGAKYRCDCQLGFEGARCETEINECEVGDACSAEGTEMCTDLVNGFQCQCRRGFVGERCEIHEDQCLGEPCLNNGTCLDLGSRFSCRCRAGWRGERCELEAGKCEERPCQNEGHCVNLEDGDYFCVCRDGVSGKNCEHAPNRCVGSPCHNGGVCGDFGSRLACTCPKGFVGEGCEFELDPCHHGVCQNGARCESLRDNDYRCHCAPGFEGPHCEKEVDECQPSPCPIGAKCVDQLNGYYCQCPFNATGAACDKPIDPDYDLRFNDGITAARAAMAVPVHVTTGALSLSLWVKFDEVHGAGDVLTVYHSQTQNGPTNITELIRVSAGSVRLALFPDENPLTLHFPSNQRLNDGKWNNLIITWSAHEGAYQLVWNGIRLYADTGYASNHELDVNVWINLGQPVEAGESEPKFVGRVTRVNLWSRTLDFDADIPAIVQHCQDGPTIFAGLVLQFANYDRLSGHVERVVRSTCGRPALVQHQHELEPAVQVERCPQDLFVTTPLKEVNVSWSEPMFSSLRRIDRVEKNLKSGQLFTAGEFRVLYVAYDNESNTAECSFKIHVAREFCPDVPNPVHGQQLCEHWGPDLRFRACSIQCDAGFDFAQPPAFFYACAADGQWRPRAADAFTFRYPPCSRKRAAERVAHLRINYPAVQLCNPASKEALRERLLQRIDQLHQKYRICAGKSDTCEAVAVQVHCEAGEVEKRARRDAAQVFGVRLSIPVVKGAVLDKSERQVDAVELVQQEVLGKDLLNLEHLVPNGRPDLNSFRIDEEFKCRMGEVAVRDACVPCAPGSYFDSRNKQCIDCAVGHYQPNEGQLTCLPCPANGVTTAPGADSAEQCKPRCDPGHQLNLQTGQCEPCGFGFYQPADGTFSCLSCGVGKTTLEQTSKSEDECRDECPDGEQLISSGSCQPCGLGMFRTRGVHKQCVQCPLGTTTEGLRSSKRSDCNTPRCDPGQFLVTATKTCQFCPRGTYQDEPLQNTCKICPPDYNTAASGATHESQCYSTNQCATGENGCSWHAVCIDLPDENDVPSFECKCKPGFRGNGTHCTDACLNFCLNDGVCLKNHLGYVECRCKDNFSGERCEIRFQPRSQKIMHATFWIGGVVLLLIVIVAAIWAIGQRFGGDAADLPSAHKPIISMDSHLNANFAYGGAQLRAASLAGSQRPLGFYYEEAEQCEEGNECKTIFLADPAPELGAAADEACQPVVETVDTPTLRRPTHEDRLDRMRQHFYQHRQQQQQ